MADRVEPNEIECSICRNLFTEPKLLPCGHLLCRQCLVSWMKTRKEALCPFCRCVIIETKQRGLRSLQDIADGFPTDLAMKELVEAQRLLSKGHHCCICEDVAATSLCLNCGDLLCKACKKAHGTLSKSQNHIMQDLSSLTAEKLAANRPSTCAVHPDETSKLYCPTHGASICLLCASSQHRNCPEVTDLEEKAQEARAKLAELAATLSAKQTEVERAMRQLDEEFQETEEHTKASIVEMEMNFAILQLKIKDCRRRLREMALNTCSEVKESVDAGKACFLQRQGKLTSHKCVIERVGGMKSPHALSTMTSAMETRVTELDCSATLPANAKDVSTVTFTIMPEVLSNLERELSTLGKVKVVHYVTVRKKEQEDAGISFHDNHGKGIVLSNNKQTAIAKDYGNGIVMVRDPMKVNMLCQVRAERSDGRKAPNMGGYIRVGVVTQFPDDVTVPHSSWLLESAVTVSHTSITDLGTTKSRPSELGSALVSNPVGRRVGVSLDSGHCLHLHVDGQRKGIIARHVPQPCYAVFDVVSQTGQVTLLPLTPLSDWMCTRL